MFGDRRQFVIAGICLAVTLAVGCSPSKSLDPSSTQGASTTSTATSTPAEISATSSTEPAPDALCRVDRPSSWDEFARAHELQLPAVGEFSAFANSADGHQVFGVNVRLDWSGVVSLSAGTVTDIAAFRDQNTGVIGGAFDGRWLVWSESHSPTDLNDWEIWSWDAATGQSTRIATAPFVDGNSVQGPFVSPVISNGKAAWVQANVAGVGEVHLYTLSDGTDRVLSSGNVVPPVGFWGSELIWLERDSPGEGHLAFADTTDGRILAVPDALKNVRHVGTSVAGSGDILVWDDGASLWLWRITESAPHRLYTAERGDYVEFIALAGDLVTWGGAQRQWAADLRSGSFTNLTAQFGWRYTNGDWLLVSQPVDDSPRQIKSISSLLNARDLPALPSCRD
jgi:hypothetical protein